MAYRNEAAGLKSMGDYTGSLNSDFLSSEGGATDASGERIDMNAMNQEAWNNRRDRMDKAFLKSLGNGSINLPVTPIEALRSNPKGVQSGWDRFLERGNGRNTQQNNFQTVTANEDDGFAPGYYHDQVIQINPTTKISFDNWSKADKIVYLRVDNNDVLGKVNNGQLFNGVYPTQIFDSFLTTHQTYFSPNNNLMIVRVIAGPNAPTGFMYKVYNGRLIGPPVISAPPTPRFR
jgi:hypothetical protein